MYMRLPNRCVFVCVRDGSKYHVLRTARPEGTRYCYLARSNEPWDMAKVAEVLEFKLPEKVP
jgi:hypothetical protein